MPDVSSTVAAGPRPTGHGIARSTLPLGKQEAEVLATLAESVTAHPATDPLTFCRQAYEAAEHLPERIARTLSAFAAGGSEAGILVIQGLPTDGTPPTPRDNTLHGGELTPMARAQAVVNHRLGKMIAYEAEGYGRLFQDMVPRRAAASSQTSLSSKAELELHTEQAFSPLRPHWLSLACLRGDTNAATYVLPVGEVVALLGDAEIALLREPLWTLGVDESFRVGGQEFLEGDLRGPMPILQGSAADPQLVLDQDLMRGTTDEAQRLFEKVLELHIGHRRSHVLQRGELLLLDNLRAVHGRSPFEPRWDGQDRFVIRSFVVRDLEPYQHALLPGSVTVAGRHS